MMQRLTSCLLLRGTLFALTSVANAEEVITSERLNRGAIAITTTGGNLVQWRKFADDDANGIQYTLTCTTASGTSKDVDFPAGSATCYLDATKSVKYTLTVKDASGSVIDEQTFADFAPMAKGMTTIQLDRPSSIYTPNDCSVGDVDGDGTYELIVKWDPNNSQDNSKSGKTADCIFDCYRIAGENAGQKLWRINLGCNVRAGAHYSPFLVYDFDGDGKAEFVVKTAPGSKDGLGKYVSEAGATANIRNITSNTTDYRNGDGHILKGEEFLTIFNGETGAAMQSIWYWPNHARQHAAGSASTTYSWSGDSYGNRGHRYNACVAYLDGLDQKPSIIMQRGYYTQAYFWAVDWDGQNLTTRWLHQGTGTNAWNVIDATGKSIASGNKSSYGQGVHGISVGDVDEDGFDEIVMGSATIDHNGRLLCQTGFGHGDAIHLSKFIPGRPGLQVFMPHEESGCGYGDDMHDPATGEILYRGYTDKDNGRGVAADYYYQFDTNTGLDKSYGGEFWSGASSGMVNAVSGQQTYSKKPSSNFRLYWTGDLYDDLFDGRLNTSTSMCDPTINTWTGSSAQDIKLNTKYSGDFRSCNYTKATPCLIADIWGDWREEIILWNGADPSQICIFTTTESTEYPVPCLMQDHVYRMGIAWQNSSYNQPAHLGYYLPDAFITRYEVAEGCTLNDTIYTNQEIDPIVIKTVNATSAKRTGSVPGLTYTFDEEAQTYTVTGTPTKTGSYSTTYTLTGRFRTCKAVGKLIVVEGETGIGEVNADADVNEQPFFDLLGRPVAGRQPGIYLQGQKKIIVK